jgi:lipopolysaccharide export LptBFGC system permease protein LptF
VNNPSLEVEDEDELELNKGKRDKSRKILLKHLNENCQETSYKPEKLTQLGNEIVVYMERKIELQKELNGLIFKEEKPTSRQTPQLASSQNKPESNSDKSNQIEFLEKEKPSSEKEGELRIVNPQELIAQLQDKKEQLLKEIAEKEKIIRQKVLKHIFNNYEAINKELGGDIFLNSVAGDHD